MSINNKGSKGKTRRTRKRKEKGQVKNNLEIVPIEELQKLTQENSFLLNPAIPNYIFQQDVIFSQIRAKSTMKVHDFLFSPQTFNNLESKDIINLYAILLNDLAKSRAQNMKLAETSEKSRFMKDLSKIMADLAKRKAEASSAEINDTTERIQILLDESIRMALDDEFDQKLGGSNTFKPVENKDYEIVTIDANADDD